MASKLTSSLMSIYIFKIITKKKNCLITCFLACHIYHLFLCVTLTTFHKCSSVENLQLLFMKSCIIMGKPFDLPVFSSNRTLICLTFMIPSIYTLGNRAIRLGLVNICYRNGTYIYSETYINVSEGLDISGETLLYPMIGNFHCDPRVLGIRKTFLCTQT